MMKLSFKSELAELLSPHREWTTSARAAASSRDTFCCDAGITDVVDIACKPLCCRDEDCSDVPGSFRIMLALHMSVAPINGLCLIIAGLLHFDTVVQSRYLRDCTCRTFACTPSQRFLTVLSILQPVPFSICLIIACWIPCTCSR